MAIVASGTVSGTGTSTVAVSFTVPADGSYYVYIYRSGLSSAPACTFTIDNLLLTYTTYTHATTCAANPADSYAWGHNGVLVLGIYKNTKNSRSNT